ncbi:hypothetical protein [Clostridium thermarum]|uniref:hypothetical protein n=1 Tax=Clostridium thermarum TaxID=1716543 RepID=UPI0013D4061A|nr:hypothetical protein [Clostridium thermarum]
MDKEILEILKNMQSDMKAMQSDIKNIKSDINELKTKQEETYQIVKALEHSTEVNRAELDKMAMDIAHIKGDVEALRKDMTNVEIITSSNWNDIAKLKAVK